MDASAKTASYANSRKPTPGATASTRFSVSSAESTPHVTPKPAAGSRLSDEAFAFVTSRSAECASSSASTVSLSDTMDVVGFSFVASSDEEEEGEGCDAAVAGSTSGFVSGISASAHGDALASAPLPDSSMSARIASAVSHPPRRALMSRRRWWSGRTTAAVRSSADGPARETPTPRGRMRTHTLMEPTSTSGEGKKAVLVRVLVRVLVGLVDGRAPTVATRPQAETLLAPGGAGERATVVRLGDVELGLLTDAMAETLPPELGLGQRAHGSARARRVRGVADVHVFDNLERDVEREGRLRREEGPRGGRRQPRFARGDLSNTSTRTSRGLTEDANRTGRARAPRDPPRRKPPSKARYPSSSNGTRRGRRTRVERCARSHRRAVTTDAPRSKRRFSSTSAALFKMVG